MKALRTVILAIIFVLLFVFVYFFEIKPSKEKKLIEERESKVLFWRPESVKTVEIDNAFGKTTIVKDSTGNWQIISPITYLADQGVMNSLVQTLYDSKWVKTIMDSAMNLDEYGLNPPSLTIKIKLANDSTYMLQLGDPVPTGNNYYAISSHSKGLRLIQDNIYNQFNKSLTEFRDKRIIDIYAGEVQKFTIKRKDATLEVYKDSTGIWRIGSPIKDKANDEYVSRLLSDLTSARAQKFVAEDTSGFAKYGFTSPLAYVNLWTIGGKQKTLILGNQVADNKELYHVYNPEMLPVFAVQKSMIEAILKPVDDFRSRKLFEITSPERIEIQGDTVSLAMVKLNNKWKIVKPETLLADESKVSMLISDITGSIVDSFLKFDRKKVSDKRFIRFFGPDTAKSEHLFLGNKKDETHAYAQLSGRDEIFLVPARILDYTGRGASYFIERKIFPIRTDEIATIELADSDGVVYKLVSSPEKQWSLVSPKNIRIEDLKELTDLLSQFKNLQFYTKRALDKPKSEYGLEKPSITIAIGTTSAERVEVKIGKEKGPYYYAYVEKQPYIYEVSSNVVNNIRKWFKEVIKPR